MDPGDTSPPHEEPFEDAEDRWGEQGSNDDLFDDATESLFDEGISPEDDGPLRGWIPPDDRLWLHPSEIGRESRVSSLIEGRKRARRSERRGLIAAGIVTSAALTAAIAAVVLAATSQNPVAHSSDTGQVPHLTSAMTASREPAKSSGTCPSAWMSQPTCAALKKIEPSMLQIVAKHGGKSEEGTAVVVPYATATVAVTSASLVGGSATVEALNKAGKEESLSVLGIDKTSGIAVIRVPWQMPAASIATQALAPGQLAVLACVGQSNSMEAAMGEVKQGNASGTKLMDAIDVAITPVATPGGLLLDSQGSVVGVLGATQKISNDLVGEFIPSWLAVGVADKLVAEHRVVHGWLDVEGTSDPRGGAVVEVVPASGPAAKAGLKAGDVVVAISGSDGTAQIQSMADLRGRLYLEPPGAHVELEVVRDGQEMTMSPVLSSAAHS
ncbi:MAG: PDZ domain-containing protein [Acidimicrobiales bacterium]